MRIKSRSYFFLLIAVIITTSVLFCARKESKLTGTWELDLKQSTDIDPWRSIKLEISQKDSLVSIKRTWSSGSLTHEETMDLKLGGISNQIPVSGPKWPDNLHLGAFVKSNTIKHAVAEWEMPNTKLKVETQVEIETSQSNAIVSTESIYELLQSGKELKLAETRSARPTPVIYVFSRI